MTEFTFDKIICPFCNESISKGGAAQTSHYRMHVRRGEAIEYKRNGHLVFLPKDSQKYIDEEPYARLGDDQLPGQPKGVWEIANLETELPSINPDLYFRTSGEAVKKAEKLVKDAYSLAVKAKIFYRKLIKTRGNNKYLEVSREGGRLLIKIKNARSKKEDDKIEGDE
jgi:hypothetical protein